MSLNILALPWQGKGNKTIKHHIPSGSWEEMLMGWPNLSQVKINKRMFYFITMTADSRTRPKFESQFAHLDMRCWGSSINKPVFS